MKAPKKYDHSKIEKKWQKEWAKKKLFEAENDSDKPKWYSLIEFPYPSGAGLHVGHVRSNTAMDIISRKRRMEGFNVLYPIGWDAFGLPTENYAIKTGKDPRVVTKENTDTFRKQLQSLGFSFDWSREINTTNPKYYKWTQWIFLQMFKAGLAYKKKMTINWCPKDKIGLANEEVVGGLCERCGTAVEKREKEQWMLAITKYADRLDKDLDDVDYLPQIKTQQRNWIGKSEGSEIEFTVNSQQSIERKEELKTIDSQLSTIHVFTTRADTLFGVSALMLSPEHPWITLALDEDHTGVLKNPDVVRDYVEKAKKKTEIDRTDAGKEKTGVKLEGVWAVNPANGEKIPVFVADYVLADYGTGAVMSVPAHDERDFAFAKKYDLPVKYVIAPRMIDHNNPHVPGKELIFRKAVIAIVRNPRTGEIINLKWKKQPWTTFVMGGVEDGEDVVEAGRREVIEETGYKNLKFIRILGGPVQSEFFATHKDVNRIAHTWSMLFELENEEHTALSEEESTIHDITWVNPETLDPKSLAHIESPLIIDKLLHGDKPYTEEGFLVDSDKFDHMSSEEAKKAITEFVGGKIVTTYKLRDWVFSRQRYWGEPIPLVYCEKCGYVPVPEVQLPVELPQVEKYQPTDTGESPLANIQEWVNVKCPQCEGDAKRETDTMPQWAGSSWYYLAYTSQGISNFQFPISKESEYWFPSSLKTNDYQLPTFPEAGPVDWYNGGMEHTTLHLLYSRFWHKFLFDQGLVPTKEPYAKRTSHGLILADGGEKMSKSKGNVVNPDDIVETWGADSFRLFEMFMGSFDQPVAWNVDNIIGVRRFLEKVWRLGQSIVNSQQSTVEKKLLTDDYKLQTILHKTIQKITDDIEGMRFNTSVSAMMMLVNEFEKQEKIFREDFETFLKLLSPFAPHIAEEIWNELGNKDSIVFEVWPKADESKMKEENVTIVVQVNGKVRGQVIMALDSSEEEVLTLARQSGSVSKWLGEGEPKKVIFVPNRLINIVL